MITNSVSLNSPRRLLKLTIFTPISFHTKPWVKIMTGVINIPSQAKANNYSQKEFPAIVMVRGYATKEQYYPGFGTNHAAQTLAKNWLYHDCS